MYIVGSSSRRSAHLLRLASSAFNSNLSYELVKSWKVKSKLVFCDWNESWLSEVPVTCFLHEMQNLSNHSPLNCSHQNHIKILNSFVKRVLITKYIQVGLICNTGRLINSGDYRLYFWLKKMKTLHGLVMSLKLSACPGAIKES